MVVFIITSKTLLLFVGTSGSGKTTIANKLSELYGLKQVVSYTTREPRHENESGHIFISESDMPGRSEMCAYTFYNGNHYFATKRQVDESDIYVIDPAGIDFFLEHYDGEKTPKIVFIESDPLVCFERMRGRGDTLFEAMKRVENDKRIFSNIKDKADVVFKNDILDVCVDEIYNYYCEQEGKLLSDK